MMEQKLLLIHTNDLHSHFEHMPRIATAIRKLRQAALPSETIVCDVGDHMDRMRIETEGTGGLANIAVLNETGYDIAVPGNNEGLTFTKDALEQVYGFRRGFSVVCANLLDAQTGERPSWMEPWLVLDKNGLKVGITAATAYYPDFYELLGWTVTDPIEAIRLAAARLRETADIVIVLSHLGLPIDKKIAEEAEGVDVILGGHTHHLLEKPLEINGTYIAATGCYGKYIGYLDLRFDPSARKVRLHSGACLETGAYEPDEGIARLIEGYAIEGRDRLSETAAVLPERLDISWDQESRLGNLLADGLKKWTGAEIGIVNAGQILRGLPEGPVTLRQLLDICPSPVNPCRIRLKGEYLWQAAEEALLAEYCGKPIKGYGFRGQVLGTLCVAGMTIEYDAGGAPGNKIRRIRIGLEPLRLERTYTVGTIDMFTFGIGYLSLAKGEEKEYFLPEFLRDVLRAQLQDPNVLRKSAQKRWLRLETV
jgi:2',3'-cyclic-nucleotide 2'-phosphodiesterase (5'-nucleotidase family)